MPRVSVIVPIYNQEDNLEASLPCLINQTWTDIEIIAVNDGSTDQSRQILEKFAKQDKRINIINKTNGGLVEAVITGIEEATGDYICFLDPDDGVGPTFVENFMEKIENHDFVAMGYYENDGKQVIEHDLEQTRVYNHEDIQELKKHFLFKPGTGEISREIFISRVNKCYKATVLKSITIQLRDIREVSLGEDSIFTYLMLSRCNSGISYIEPNCYVYNTNSNTSMTKHGSAYKNYKQAQKAYDSFMQVVDQTDETSQPIMLYFFLSNNLIGRLHNECNEELCNVYKLLHDDNVYLAGDRMYTYNGRLQRIKRLLWNLPNGVLYHRALILFDYVVALVSFIRSRK